MLQRFIRAGADGEESSGPRSDLTGVVHATHMVAAKSALPLKMTDLREWIEVSSNAT